MGVNTLHPPGGLAAKPHSPNAQPGPHNPNHGPKFEPIRIVLASLDNNTEQFAREAAHEERAAQEKQKRPFFRRFARSVWHTLTSEYQITKATQEKHKAILENRNLRHHHGESDDQWRAATVRRYVSNYAEHLVHEERGETYHKLGEDEALKDPQANRIREDVFDVVKQYARGDIADKDSLEAVIDRLNEEWREAGVSQQYIGEGRFLAHNLGSAGEQVKAALDAQQGLSALEQEALMDKMLADAEVVTGEARVGSNVEIESTLSERLAKKMKKAPFLNESRIARVTSVVGNEVFVAGVLSATLFAVTKTASIVPGVGAAIVGGIRERRALRDERALMGRRGDSNQEVDPQNRRQKKLAESLYESRSAGELIDAMGALYSDAGDLALLGRDELNEAIRLQAEIQARLTIERRQPDARLINFADMSAGNMEDRRFDLELASAKLEEDLKRLFGDPQEAALLNINPDEEYDELFQSAKFIEVAKLSGEMETKDKLFSGYLRNRILGRALITLATVVGGQAALHGLSMLAENVAEKAKAVAEKLKLQSPDLKRVGAVTAAKLNNETGRSDDISSGAAENISSGAAEDISSGGGQDIGSTSEDIGSGSAENIGGYESTPSGEQVIISESAKINLPDGYKAEAVGDQVKITGPKGESFIVGLEKDGTLSPSAIDVFKAQGLAVGDHAEVVQGEPKITEQDMTAVQFAEKHKSEMVKIKHAMWYTNNTSGKYDFNELGLHNFMDKSGNHVVSVKGMTSGGSFQGASGVDWKEAANQGQLMVYLSASKGTQSFAFEIPINPDGTVTIDKNSPAGALFDERGRFIGGYQEVAVKGATTPEGATKIATLATVVGKNSPTLTDTISTPSLNTVHTYTVSSSVDTTLSGNFVEESMLEEIFDLPGLPIYARTKLGQGAKSNDLPPLGIVNQGAAPTAPSSGAAAGSAPSGAGQNGYTPFGPQTPNNPSSGTGTGKEDSQEQNQASPASGHADATGKIPDDDTDKQQSQTGGEHANAGSYSREDVEFLVNIRKANRPFPRGFTIDFTGVQGDSRRIAIEIMYMTLLKNPHLPNEDVRSWRFRIAEIIVRGLPDALGVLDRATPGMQRLYFDALNALVTLRPTGKL